MNTEDGALPPDPKPDPQPVAETPLQALIPKPAVTFIALFLALLLGFHVVWDALDDSYSNSGVTFLLGAMVLTTFGVPLGKAIRDMRP